MAYIRIGTHSPADFGAAFVAENATLAGSVLLKKDCSVWYGAVLRADTGHIVIGEGSNVQDNAVLHTGPGLDVMVGRGVSIGHGAIVHGCTVGDRCLIAAGALVPENAVIPAGSLVMGVPGRVVKPVTAAQTAAIAKNEQEYRELARLHAAAR